MYHKWTLTLAAACVIGLLGACSDDDSGNDGMAGSAGVAGSAGSAGSGQSGAGSGQSGAGTGGSAGTGASQTPPQGATAVEAWLKSGDYKSWHAESTIHEARSPSPHGFNRIYSNDLVSANASGTADWPEGAAAVKELYASATDSTPVGYAVYLKTKADSAGGANWYWYERVPLDHPAPHDAAGVVADGMGDSGPAKNICVGCHAGAGTDAPHTPTAGGRDQVYTPVP